VQAALRHPVPAGIRSAQRFVIPGLPEWSIAVLHDVPGDARVRIGMIARRWGLTPRQSSVLLLVAEGASNRTIAERLACSEKTVELHVSALLAKTRTVSRSQLVASFWTEPA
jgi:DNA-binding NarL/FixJ family response regulator